MAVEAKTMNVLLVSDCPDKAAMLAQLMEQQSLSVNLHRMQPSRSAVDYARRSGRYRRVTPHHFILFDFSEPDKACLSTVSTIAFGANRAPAPLVLLTSPESESLLYSGRIERGDSCMFSPTSLNGFLRYMREHSVSRILHSLSILSDLGPVLVRLPGYFMRDRDDISARAVA